MKCVNNSYASRSDYSKFDLYLALSSQGVPTPATLFVGSYEEIVCVALKAVEKFQFPIVVKRNCGGKSYEVTRVYSVQEIIDTLQAMFTLAEKQGYEAGFLLQEFMVSTREHDCRVGVIEKEYSFAYARSLISRNSDDKWMASTSGGSYEFAYEPSKAEKEVALKANIALGASFSESDVMMTKNGPVIIEVNLSPGYFLDSVEDLQRMEMIVNKLVGTVEESPSQSDVVALEVSS